MEPSIPDKANRVLNVVFFAFLLILSRVFYLAVVQHDVYVDRARKPQTRVVVEPVERGIIEDRFGVPLATNKLHYRIGLCYGPIRAFPRIKRVTQSDGSSVRIYPRKEYVEKLSLFLSEVLGLDAQEIRDLMYAKAVLFPQTTFPLQEGLSEEQYYRLKALERKWPGLRVERTVRRCYPQGKTACDVVGHLGAISDQEYQKLLAEMETLRSYLELRDRGAVAILPAGYENPVQVRERLQMLEERGYTLHDWVGKAGIEAKFDEALRGSAGKKIFAVDFFGNVLRSVPGGRIPIPGQNITLSISAELQEYAEQLLAQLDTPSLEKPFEDPWIHGGALVAMIPQTGEVVALASYPRYDPNDFIRTIQSTAIAPLQRDREREQEKGEHVRQWLEHESHMGAIWDGVRPFAKEFWDERCKEWTLLTTSLSWERYLNAILSPGCQVRSALDRVGDVETAYTLADTAEFLHLLTAPSSFSAVIDALYPDAPHVPTGVRDTLEGEQAWAAVVEEDGETLVHLRALLDPYLLLIEQNGDKILFLDLCRLAVPSRTISPALATHIGRLSLPVWHALRQQLIPLRQRIRDRAAALFHRHDLPIWRAEHFSHILAKKREREEELGIPARPFTDYLRAAEQGLFSEFWNRLEATFIEGVVLGGTPRMPPFPAELLAPYRSLLAELHEELSSTISPEVVTFLQSLSPETARLFLEGLKSFSELDAPLLGRYRRLRTDAGVQRMRHLAAAFYPRDGFGYARSFAFRQWIPQGSIFKLITSYQALREAWETAAADGRTLHDCNPLTLVDDIHAMPRTPAKQVLGYNLQGEPYFRLHQGGRLPGGHPNVGRLDLLGALEQSSNLYFSILALEKLGDPQRLPEAARLFGFGERTGIELPFETAGFVPSDVHYNRTGLYSLAIGQHSLLVTPLQTAAMVSALANGGHLMQPTILHRTLAGQRDLRASSWPAAQPACYERILARLGLHFPLFPSVADQSILWTSSATPSALRREIFLPSTIRSYLLEGMHRVIHGERGLARSSIIRAKGLSRDAKTTYRALAPEMVGKTSTAEVRYQPFLDRQSRATIRNHISFGAISFQPPHETETKEELWSYPELVVVVYHRLGSAGKQTAPLTAQIVQKWRDLQREHSSHDNTRPL